MGKREIETLDSKASLVSFSEIVEALKLRVEQDAKKLEVFEAQLEAMKNQVQCIELLSLRVELLEKEVMLLSEKIKTNEVLKPYQLKDYSDVEMHLDELHANLNAVNDTRQKTLDSDGESTVDGRNPVATTYNEQPQESSPIKMFQPTTSNVEKFKQKKIMKTIKIMETDHEPIITRDKSQRETKLGPSLRTPYRGTKPAIGMTTIINQSMAIVGRGYDPFAPVDEQKVEVLNDWLQLDE
ncbi:uncharacterized protein LOC111829266 [Capsella rubella]|uniref:uncharacterized protein LOC111829266 n=1 Tax=Capsella rubella TaxID=81985 RepID=UPI000CD5534B|nr:uncharacterized protein LOC111829266 [Capsella rubella]